MTKKNLRKEEKENDATADEFADLLAKVLRAAAPSGYSAPGQSLAVCLAAARGIQHVLEHGGEGGMADIGYAHSLANSIPTELLCEATSTILRDHIGPSPKPAAKPKKRRSARK